MSRIFRSPKAANSPAPTIVPILQLGHIADDDDASTFAKLPENHRSEAATETCRGKRLRSNCKSGQTIVKRCQTVVKRSLGRKESSPTSSPSAPIGDPASSNLVYHRLFVLKLLLPNCFTIVSRRTQSCSFTIVSAASRSISSLL